MTSPSLLYQYFTDSSDLCTYSPSFPHTERFIFVVNARVRDLKSSSALYKARLSIHRPGLAGQISYDVEFVYTDGFDFRARENLINILREYFLTQLLTPCDEKFLGLPENSNWDESIADKTRPRSDFAPALYARFLSYTVGFLFEPDHDSYDGNTEYVGTDEEFSRPFSNQLGEHGFLQRLMQHNQHKPPRITQCAGIVFSNKMIDNKSYGARAKTDEFASDHLCAALEAKSRYVDFHVCQLQYSLICK